ncbi:MAG: glutamate synthase subunit beta [Bdellovibrionales bacterium]|nr:glutamate synthase subunit beta [Bdellovibrionales bacterium]
MANNREFIDIARQGHSYRPTEERRKDWKEVEVLPHPKEIVNQSHRCMDCGVPYCMSQSGCPLGNLIPEWNLNLQSGDLESAWAALEETNNFPEITGRLCPAPCESACVAGKDGDPVSIRAIEQSLADQAFANNWIRPQAPRQRLNSRVAIIGSGPAGLSAGQQLNRLGHSVTIFEKSPEPGGLLRFGIPDFKYDKSLLNQRIAQLVDEGIEFQCGTEVGRDISLSDLNRRFHALGLALGAEQARDLNIPGRHLSGIHLAMDFLVQQNIANSKKSSPHQNPISALNKTVVVIGGGDTGSDCVGTAIRQGAKSVLQLEMLPRPPKNRSSRTPWPQWPMKLRSSHAHEEGGQRQWSLSTQEFLGDSKGQIRALRVVDLSTDETLREIPNSMREIPADLVLIAIGFAGPKEQGILSDLGLQLDPHSRPLTRNYQTSIAHVFAGGDMRRGQSLIVWAINEGRMMANSIHHYLKTCKNPNLV